MEYPASCSSYNYTKEREKWIEMKNTHTHKNQQNKTKKQLVADDSQIDQL